MVYLFLISSIILMYTLMIKIQLSLMGHPKYTFPKMLLFSTFYMLWWMSCTHALMGVIYA